jgi:OOP family OmpA-OmpF porin
MAKRSLFLLIVVMVVSLMFGCATQKPMVFKAVNLNTKVKAGMMAPKVDNFLVILDASASMSQRFNNQCKLQVAKDFVTHMNQTIPDIFLMAGLRKFGQSILTYQTKSELVYGMTQYDRDGLAKALAPIKSAGTTPLTAAIDAGTGDLASVRGASAVIIVSDGLDVGDAPAAAQRMKKAYGDRVCIYAVLVGNDAAGGQVMERIAAAGECGFAVNALEAGDGVGMASFVQDVFLKEAVMAATPAPPPKPKPLDSDGDGVIDARDKCPNTPGGVEVGGDGCPFDTDMDGVPDYLDKCPKTPVDAPVDEKGCWTIRPVEFDTAKWDIKPWFYPVLDQIAGVFKKNPWLEVIVEGHTDIRGGEEYNLRLSDKRANAVLEYLVKKGLNPDKLTTIGYGYAKPVGDNKAPEGRARNRRSQVRFIQ